mgnify:CR=1 FL=1
MKRLFRLQYNAPVTLTFALLSLLALLLGRLTDGWTNTYLFSVWRSSLSDILTYPRFFLHVLGHADYNHYIGNMMMILVVGPGLEEKYGSRNLLSVIVITALVVSPPQHSGQTGISSYFSFRAASVSSGRALLPPLYLHSAPRRQADMSAFSLIGVLAPARRRKRRL